MSLIPGCGEKEGHNKPRNNTKRHEEEVSSFVSFRVTSWFVSPSFSYCNSVSKERPRVLQDVLDVEAKLTQRHVAGGRCSEAINRDAIALRANVSVPAETRARFD